MDATPGRRFSGIRRQGFGARLNRAKTRTDKKKGLPSTIHGNPFFSFFHRLRAMDYSV